MKNKKTIYILVSILAVCLLGVVLSKVINWPVDTSKSSGNIAKTSRFNRKTASDGASNMQELLLNDEEYKNGILATYVIMKARADQFGALVNLSSEVAGDIKDFQPVLKEMKKALPTVNNVSASLKFACEDLDAVFGGETPASLEQDANNAALAYTTLQKLNNLANDFIKTTDNYLKGSDADNRLKLIRDQWVSYQQITAALTDDAQLAKDLEERGFLLDVEQSRSALNSFDNTSFADLRNTVPGAAIANAFQFENNIANVFVDAGLKNTTMGADLKNAGTMEEQLRNTTMGADLKNAGTMEEQLRNTTIGADLKNAGTMEEQLRNTTMGTDLKNAGSMEEQLRNTTMGADLRNGEIVDAGLINNTIGDLSNLRSAFDLSQAFFNTGKIEVISNTFDATVKALANGQVAELDLK